MTKLNYLDAINKHKTRDLVFNRFRKYSNIKSTNSIIGLAGPNINEYIKNLRDKGFNKIQVFENNKDILLNQLGKLTDQYELGYTFGNINNCPIVNNTLYDLDYCCTTKYIDFNLLNKLDNYILTVSLRGYGLERTLQDYADNVYKIPYVTKSINRKGYCHVMRYNTKISLYKYRDTSPMLTIIKLKTH